MIIIMTIILIIIMNPLKLPSIEGQGPIPITDLTFNIPQVVQSVMF